jgi:hypothetical protein
LDDPADGSSGQKLCVPAHLRGAVIEIGLQGALAPINLFEAREKDPVFRAGDAWTHPEFEVALDLGAVVHVCSPQDCPGYVLEESAGSRRGHEFLTGDGGTIPNVGQKSLNLSDDGKNFQSVFRIAAVTRPLMSVGRICDEGHRITFDAVMAVVNNSDGSEICGLH